MCSVYWLGKGGVKVRGWGRGGLWLFRDRVL